MKHIAIDERLYAPILEAYLDYLYYFCTQKSAKKYYVFETEIKGVRHNNRSIKREIRPAVDCLGKKISEKIVITLKYSERSKKLLVLLEAVENSGFINSFCRLEKKCFRNVLKSYLNELLRGLLEALLPVEKAALPAIECYLRPYVIKNSPNVFNFPKTNPSKAFIDDILVILYNIYLNRKTRIAYIKVSACDILFLKGANVVKYRNKVHIARAVEFLNTHNLIYAYKLKRFEWAIFVPENNFLPCYFIDKKLLSLNIKTKYFEKILGDYICYLVHNGVFEFKVNEALKYFNKNNPDFLPSKIRDKIEAAFDTLQTLGVIKSWEYKKIEEDKLTGKNWILEYKKLKIIFRIKKAEHFRSA